MRISETEEDGFYIIQIYGDVDAASSITLDKAIEESLRRGFRKLLIDCSHLNYISSAGLGVFMSYLEEFREKEVHFALFHMKDTVRNVFEILGLDQLMRIVASAEEAKN